MTGDDDRARIARINRLEAENRVLRADLDQFRIGVVIWSTVIAVIVALALPMFDRIEPDPLSADDEVAVAGPESVTIFGLAGQAGEASNGTVRIFAIIVGAGLVALAASAVLALGRRAWWLCLAVAVLLAFAWLLLLVSVSVSGEGGAVGDLGYSGTFRVVAIPVTAAIGAAAALVARDVGD